jgi:SAM-dependent methyltransferase
MSYDHSTREKCRLCSSSDLIPVVDLPDTVPGEHLKASPEVPDPEMLPISLHQCGGCGHVQINSIPDPSSLFNEHYTFMPSNNPQIIKHFTDTIDYFLANHKADVRFAFEFGSNDGLFLEILRKKTGCKVLGMDPSLPPVEVARRRGIETIHDFFGQGAEKDIVPGHGQADVVIANNVFAHIDDLQGILASVGELLSDGGYFVFEVSNLLDIVNKFLIGTIIHEHLSHHSTHSLIPFLRVEGFQLADVINVNHIQGGAIICIAKKTSEPTGNPTIERILKTESDAGITSVSGMKAFNKRLHETLYGFREELTGLPGADNIITYGAARSAPFILQLMDIDNRLACCIDDNPHKTGKFLPISNIPIHPSSHLDSLDNSQPHNILITGWAQSQRISSRLQSKYDCNVATIFPDFKVTRC